MTGRIITAVAVVGVLLTTGLEAQDRALGTSRAWVIAYLEHNDLLLEWEEHPGLREERLLGIQEDPYLLVELDGPPEDLYGVIVSMGVDEEGIVSDNAILAGTVAMRAVFPLWGEGAVDWYLDAVWDRTSRQFEHRRCGVMVTLLKGRSGGLWILDIRLMVHAPGCER